jgi:molybdate transport system substrate-binding protein
MIGEMKTLFAVLAVALVAATAAAARPARLHVYAATSLAGVLPRIDAGEAYTFAGSSKLAARIEAGARVDVFASANTSDPRELYAKGLVTKPVVFARNSIVIVTPRGNPAHIRAAADVARAGVEVEVADTSVALGEYTLQVLKTLRLAPRIAGRDDDVRTVVSKVEAGKVDAAFVYSSDARAAGAKVHVVAIPSRAQPVIAYAAAVVKSSAHAAESAAFVQALRSARAQRLFRSAGFR